MKILRIHNYSLKGKYHFYNLESIKIASFDPGGNSRATYPAYTPGKPTIFDNICFLSLLLLELLSNINVLKWFIYLIDVYFYKVIN